MPTYLRLYFSITMVALLLFSKDENP